MLLRYIPYISICHNLPRKRQYLYRRHLNGSGSSVFQKWKLPRYLIKYFAESPSPNWKFINLCFQNLSHKKSTYFLYSVLLSVEKYSLSTSCFNSFPDKTELRKPNAYTSIHRKSWCNCLWKNDPWKVKVRNWFHSEIFNSQ